MFIPNFKINYDVKMYVNTSFLSNQPPSIAAFPVFFFFCCDYDYYIITIGTLTITTTSKMLLLSSMPLARHTHRI